MSTLKTPFRYDFVGSFLRPEKLKEAKKNFEEANIKVLWQDFKHPVYPQLHGEFIPYLSSIDVFFNCGIEKSREILRNV